MVHSLLKQRSRPAPLRNVNRTVGMRVSAHRIFSHSGTNGRPSSVRNTESRAIVPFRRTFPENNRRSTANFPFRGNFSERNIRSTAVVPFRRNFQESTNQSSTAESSPSRDNVKKILELFRENLKNYDNEKKMKGIVLHQLIATNLGKSNWVNTKKRLGAVPGVEVGDKFMNRTELSITGVHLPSQKGIDYLADKGTLLATSIVATDHYCNELKSDTLIYTGEGGSPDEKGLLVKDQVLEHGNLALKNSKEWKEPVRVIVDENLKSFKARMFRQSPSSVYIYDGLYLVEKWWKDKAESGKMVFKFQMRKMSGGVESNGRFVYESNKWNSRKEVRIINDISEGQEKIRIPVVNGVDSERPSQFSYAVKMIDLTIYSSSLPTGCNCMNNCSDSEDCSCKVKNGQEIPYDKSGRLVLRRPCVYECGPSCCCSDSCANRVSQLGINLQLQVFKTLSKRWGIRSRSYVRAGSFICEYIGKVIRTTELEERAASKEYVFDIGEDYDDRVLHNSSRFHICRDDDGYSIDAEEYGNISRFINHSCTPNLFVQNVLYDDSERPHVMFFAMRDIPPFTELTYNYNCRLSQLRYIDGNFKAKKCVCRSPDCIGQFY